MGFNVLSTEVSAGEVLASPFRPRFCNIIDFYHYALMHPLKTFYTTLSGAPEKCFKSGPTRANAGPGAAKLL